MKVLLTGAFGNIGFSTLQTLLQQGHSVRCFDKRNRQAEKKALQDRDYLGRILDAMGIGMLPESAFGHDPYCTDWLDTEDSERLLHLPASFI